MKTGKTLRELIDELNRQHDVKRDFVVPSCGLKLCHSAQKLNVGAAHSHPLDGFDVSPTTHRQIGTFTGIPAQYYDRMQREMPYLLETNVNSWMQKLDKPRMVRTLDGRARALLSDRYCRIDNLDIARVIVPILERDPQLEIVSCDVTERHMYIKAVTPRLRGNVDVGDIVQGGVCFKNSEVGFGAVTIVPLVLQLRCLNGWVTNIAAFRKMHVGQRQDEGELVNSFMSDETKKAEDKTFVLKIRDVTEGILSTETFDKIVESMKEAKDDKVEASPKDAIKELSNRFQLTETESDDVLEAYIQRMDYSRYGLGAAVTQASQKLLSYDRATEMEEIGGKILDLSPRDWETIKVAA